MMLLSNMDINKIKVGYHVSCINYNILIKGIIINIDGGYITIRWPNSTNETYHSRLTATYIDYKYVILSRRIII